MLEGNSSAQIASEWMLAKKSTWSDVHFKKMTDILNANILSYIGNKPIDTLKPLEMLRLFQKIEERGALEVTRIAYQRCSEIFKYAVVITGRFEYNPCADLSGALKKHERQHFAHLLENELPAFLTALFAYNGSR